MIFRVIVKSYHERDVNIRYIIITHSVYNYNCPLFETYGDFNLVCPPKANE